MKVFIADDSEIIRERLVVMISKLKGVEIIGEAEDVSGAIKSITEKMPGIVILDIKMPGGSGIDVLKKLKEKKLNPVVIIITNYPYPELRKACFEAGADFFFDKSLEFGALLRALKILAVDDKKDNLISLSALLRSLIPNCVVITALSGVEGIEKVKKRITRYNSS